jgi:hypothetical protein
MLVGYLLYGSCIKQRKYGPGNDATDLLLKSLLRTGGDTL